MKSNNKILYLGLDPARFKHQGALFHYPVIRTLPLPFDVSDCHLWTHIICTSRTTVEILFSNCHPRCHFIAVGQATVEKIKEYGTFTISVAEEERAEGIVALLSSLVLKDSYLFYPHSEGSRALIGEYLQKNKIAHRDTILYKTVADLTLPPPDLKQFDEIVFTSPSVVDAFLALYGELPIGKKLTAIGPVTQNRLNNHDKEIYV